MFRGIVTHLRFWRSNLPKVKPKPPQANVNPKTAVLNLMADKLRAMQETISRTSPRSFSFFFILSTIPTFYLVKKLLQTEYNDEMFYTRIRQILNYYYLKNMFLFSSAVVLSAFRFVDPAAKFTIMATQPKWVLVPLFASVLGLAIPSDWLSNLVVMPAIVTEATSIITNVNLAAEGVLPFWFYNYRHYLQLFDIVVLIICAFALNRLRDRMDTKPHEFHKAFKQV